MKPLAKVRLTVLRASDQPRPLITEAVDKLASSMGDVGLIQPITVRPMTVINGIAEPGFQIVAGHHRVAAARALGWTDIDAFVIDEAADHLHAELIEIDENLCRSELTPAQRAAAIKRRKQIWEAMHPAEKGGTTRPTLGGEQKVGFASDTSSASGMSKKDINRHVARATAVEEVGSSIADLAGTSLDKGTELDALAKLPTAQRKALIKQAKDGEKVSAKPTDTQPGASQPGRRGRLRAVDLAHADRATNTFIKLAVALRDGAREIKVIRELRGATAISLRNKLSAALAVLDGLEEVR